MRNRETSSSRVPDLPGAWVIAALFLLGVLVFAMALLPLLPVPAWVLGRLVPTLAVPAALVVLVVREVVVRR